ncbi:MAG: FAD-dependent oxidoreductase [Bacteroidales bacterium]|nr:FAD-dependent oxidoreductase [Bacteroidales bacterium]
MSDNMNAMIKEPAREIPVRASVDILVVGGGPSGVMAARAAAAKENKSVEKAGGCYSGSRKVMLIESRGYLGGNLTIGLPILGFLNRKGEQIIKGLPQEFIDRMRAVKAASGHVPCKNHMSLTIIDPESAKTVCQEMLEEAGVDILMYVFCVGVVKEGDTVKGVIIESKAGREAILAKTVIDCTGDGDVAFRAGVECRKGDDDGGMQPPTLMYNMRNVDVDRLRDALSNHPDIFDMDVMPPEQFGKRYFITVGLRNQIKAASEAGFHIPVARTILITGLKDDEIWVNMSRVSGVDSTDPVSYTRGELTARKQIYEISAYLEEFVPGFEKARIETVAPFTGIRESRVMVGKYILTAQDILECRRFDDAIAVAGYPVDIHHSKGTDCTMYFCPDSYDIPYRCLVPAKTEGLLVAGRCSSMNHEAMASTRVMSTCMAMGEAAGRAARIASDEGVLPSGVDVDKVRRELRETGAYLK